jgi:hypothetical protein
MVTRKIIGALLVSTSAAVLPAQAQFCSTSGTVTTLNFDVRPSLVVNKDAILDTTFGVAGLSGGDATETLFSFKHTVGAILESAGAPNTAASREAFVQTMLDTFSPSDTTALNRKAGVLVPFDTRSGEASLSAAGMLNEADTSATSIAMRPLALFNRFDLAPDNWSHCGEYRIVYGKINPNLPAVPNRFLLIFEAAVPNPNPAAGEAGCRPITEFWAGLNGSETVIAKKLHAFFYQGKTDPSHTRADLLGPVVDYRNYGGDGNRGQVRGNMFRQFPWQLREWLTQLTFDPNQPRIAFVTDTVKDNPIAELYKDDLTGTGLLDANVGAAVTVLQGDFIQALSTTIRKGLMSEETKKYQTLKDELPKFALGSAPVQEPEVLLSSIALGNDNRFNELQSTSSGGGTPPPEPDDIKVHAPAGSKLRTVLGQLTSASSKFLRPQNADVFLSRAQAGTCAGCHMLSPGSTIRIDAAAMPEVTWPAVVDNTDPPAGAGFVHVREDRLLSPALETTFLPFRRYVLGRHLCLPSAPTPAVASADVAATEDAALMPGGSGSMRFVQGIIDDFLESGAPAEAAAASAAEPDRLMEAIDRLPAADRAILRERVRDEIAQARESELQRPGAFVEVRRPH